MTKKYEFVPGDEITIAPGRTVKRIRALVDIPRLKVIAGDLGGYIEHEGNLSHDDSAWVSDNAVVRDSAEVRDRAVVRDGAEVRDRAVVRDGAEVRDRAVVRDSAVVSGRTEVHAQAEVRDSADVGDSANVSGSAVVRGLGRVCGNMRVGGNADISGRHNVFVAINVGRENGTLTVYRTKDGSVEVTRGCFRGTPAEFLAASDKVHGERIRREYQLLIEAAVSRIGAAQAQQHAPES